ncbi:putative lipoprotein [Bacteroidetes bacterium oral taxon 272 str. F0290]|nr:putative lipoprotein [Bacteroidetes bacterium oral taxon 272 str. F0290]
MKRIQSILLAIAMLLATPAFFTSCQEDAPEINYTMNVSVINDFTKVVEAINNGFLKNEEAIKKLTEAIDKMNADQQTKLQAIIDVLNSVNATLETKLAAIEAAIKAQTLTQIIQKLEELKEKIGNGGGGSGGGGSTEEYVDLGLPSGVKWAKCNLGASKPTDYGDYYAWGETEPKAEYTWANYKWMQTGQSDWKHITKYTVADGQTAGIWYDAGGNFIGDNKTTLEAADDAATAKLGSSWRMPTEGEIKELLDNYTWTETTQDGKNGYEVKGSNGNAIFLPAAGYRVVSGLYDAGSWGYYWSSSLSTVYSFNARGLNLDSGVKGRGRGLGFTVRPVRP